jgi:glycosyltransferase involved in cell wall biosynthesis
MPVTWHLLTGEYPPSAGGVGDYTALLARALADAGDSVDVWVGEPVQPFASGPLRVHALPDRFGSRSRTALTDAWKAAPGTVLLQYVPNALGHRGMNVAFCRWLVAERQAGRDVRVMFHEPYLYFTATRPWRNVAAVAQRVMAALLVRASTQVYYSSASWQAYLARYGAGRDAIVLPIPSTIPSGVRPVDVGEFRRRVAPGARVVGHFGTFGEHVGDELRAALPALFERDGNVRVILIGRGSERFLRRLEGDVPSAAERVHATGDIDAAAAAVAITACDVMFQPYPDGVTTRRTSVMAGLACGVATVSTAGTLTEPVWTDTRAVALVPPGNVPAAVTEIRRLLDDRPARDAQAARGLEAYRSHFAMELTVARLRAATAVTVPA